MTVAENLKLIEALSDRLEKLEKLLTDKDIAISRLEERVKILEETGTTIVNDKTWSTVVNRNKHKTQVQMNMLNTVAIESKERDKRERNVIIFGIKESSKTTTEEKKIDDSLEIQQLLSQVSIPNEKVIRCYRIRSRDTQKPGPLIVEMEDKKTRNEFLKMSHRKFQNVYVNPDLTEAQRDLDKKLRDEMKQKNAKLDWDSCAFYYRIRNNEVVQINKKTELVIVNE
jgi:hypothetical protein